MNSKRMLLRLLQQVLSFSSLFVHQTRPALSIIEESVKELIVERRLVYFDLFTVKMKTNRTRNAATCSSLGAHHLSLGGSSCSPVLKFWNTGGFVEKVCLTRGSRVVGNSFSLNMPWRGRVCIVKSPLFKEFGQNQSTRPGMQNGFRG